MAIVRHVAMWVGTVIICTALLSCSGCASSCLSAWGMWQMSRADMGQHFSADEDMTP